MSDDLDLSQIPPQQPVDPALRLRADVALWRNRALAAEERSDKLIDLLARTEHMVNQSISGVRRIGPVEWALLLVEIQQETRR